LRNTNRGGRAQSDKKGYGRTLVKMKIGDGRGEAPERTLAFIEEGTKRRQSGKGVKSPNCTADGQCRLRPKSFPWVGERKKGTKKGLFWGDIWQGGEVMGKKQLGLCLLNEEAGKVGRTTKERTR